MIGEKNGTKRSLLVEERSGPLAIVVAGANVHDTKRLEATLDAIIARRPAPIEVTQNLCLDKGYDKPTGHRAVQSHGNEGAPYFAIQRRTTLQRVEVVYAHASMAGLMIDTATWETCLKQRSTRPTYGPEPTAMTRRAP